MAFLLSKQSMELMNGVHSDLIAVVKAAIVISEVDFKVTEGVRTRKRQQQLYDAGASRLLNSRHLTGHAVDLAAKVGDEVRWDWPLYSKIATAMKTAARQLQIPIIWGGDWRNFKDGPHFELPRDHYPVIRRPVKPNLQQATASCLSGNVVNQLRQAIVEAMSG